jgi:hypothetical protein
MELDYNEYDSLSILIKKKESSAILSYYKSFGWEEYERRDDKRYFDILHIKLKRRHKIPNKDRLQFLQVEMENVLNTFSVFRKKRHLRSFISSLFFAFFAISLVSLGVFLIFLKLAVAFAVSLVAFGIVSAIFAFPIVKKISVSENKRYILKFKETASSISRIIFQAERLLNKKCQNG